MTEGLDPGIASAVELLRSVGVETVESCEGGEGHTWEHPTVRFSGAQFAGWEVLGAAQRLGLNVLALKRVWSVVDGEPTGPEWELEFR